MILLIKTITFCCIALLFSQKSFAQIEFEKGYIIDNSNKKIECQIKNEDWKNNPTEFQYKTDESGELKMGNAYSVKEFGISGYSKFISAKVDIDRSSNDVNQITDDKDPIWSNETLFLKVIMIGKAKLYGFENPGIKRFFYSKTDDKIQQLIYKRYRAIDISQIAENRSYQQQLWVDLRCPNDNIATVEKLKYEQDPLEKYFRKYSKCNGVEITEINTRPKKQFYNLKLGVGVNYTNLAVNNNVDGTEEFAFDNKIGYRLGLESEFILPFNKNRWSILFEPTFQYFKAENEKNNRKTAINYGSVEFPLGFRYYTFLKSGPKIFINAAYITHFSLNFNSKIDFGKPAVQGSQLLSIDPRHSFAVGAGVEKNRMSAELRYYGKRELLNEFIYLSTDYSRIALILGYKLIEAK